jgi:hypothetical protein
MNSAGETTHTPDTVLPEDQQAIAKGLNEVVLILESLSIPYVLEGGTLLGIIRENRFLPWDVDVGIAVAAEEIFPKKENLKEVLSDAGFRLSDLDDTFENCKINAIKYGARYEITGWFLRGRYRRRYHYRMAPGVLSEKKLIHFMNYPFMIPAQPEKYLYHFYGNWKVPVKGGRFHNFLCYDQGFFWGRQLRKLFGRQ